MTSLFAGRARHLGPLLLLAIPLGLAACHPNDPQNTFTANGYVAKQQADLFWLCFWWATAVFIIVQALLLIVMFKFRRRATDGDGLPTQVHGNTRFELGWTILPTLVLVFVGVPSVQTLFDLEDPPQQPL